MTKKKVTVEMMVEVAVKGLQEKKGIDIVSIDLRGVSGAFTDFFVICHGGSGRQIDALADSVENEMRLALKEKAAIREGNDVSEWILLDYYNIIVHIFTESKRNFYHLEDLWGDGKIKSYE